MFHKTRQSAARLIVIGSMAIGAVGVPTFAAEYVLQPSVAGELTHDTNLLLSRDDQENESLYLKMSPRLRGSVSTGQWQAVGDVTASFIRFDDNEFDTDNQKISLQLTRTSERFLLQVSALNDRQSTRGVELDDLGEVDFGVERRDRQYIRPSATWTLNPTNRISVGVSAENVHYGGVQFSDYDYYGADFVWTHQYDEKTQFSVTTFGSEYLSTPPLPRGAESDECGISGFFPVIVPGVGIDFVEVRQGVVEDFDSGTLGVQLGASRQPNSRFSYRGSFGYRNVETTNSGRCLVAEDGRNSFNTSSSSDGFVLDTGMAYQGEKYGIDLSLSRTVSPVGLGFLTERDSFNLNVSYRYSERISLGFLIYGFSTESIDDDLNYERDILRITPKFTWRVTEKFKLNGGVRFRSVKTLNSGGTRDGIVTYLGFDYAFKPTRLSR